jgi:hypothetical protein
MGWATESAVSVSIGLVPAGRISPAERLKCQWSWVRLMYGIEHLFASPGPGPETTEVSVGCGDPGCG